MPSTRRRVEAAKHEHSDIASEPMRKQCLLHFHDVEAISESAFLGAVEILNRDTVTASAPELMLRSDNFENMWAE